MEPAVRHVTAGQKKPPRYKYSFSSEVPLPAGAAVFYTRSEVRSRPVRLVTIRDIQELLLLGFYLCVAAIIPARHWNAICRFISGLRNRKHRRKLFATLERDLKAVAPAADPEEFFREYRTVLHRRRLFYMAQVSGWHWKPRIVVQGTDEIRAASSRGKGVLIWCENTAAQTLIGKRALHEAGIEAYQVHAREHGFSTTAFGKRALNPTALRIENRFLKGRLPFGATEAIHVSRRVLQALRANAIVLIAANTYYGRRFVQVPIGARGYAHFATTPANFAAKGKTALLTMATVETVPFMEFRVVIRPHAAPKREAPGGRDAAIAEIVAAVRDAAESAVVNFPAQCLGIGRDLVGHSLDERVAGFRSKQLRSPAAMVSDKPNA